MEPFPTKIAEVLDGWASNDRCRVVESPEYLVADKLTASDAEHLVELFEQLQWTIDAEDSNSVVHPPFEFSADFGPFKVLAVKPTHPDTALFVTMAGLQSYFEKQALAPRIQIGGRTKAFETYGSRFSSWNDISPFEPLRLKSNPRSVVRDHTGKHQAVADVSPWLLREGETVCWKDPVAKLWSEYSAAVLIKCLASEIEVTGELLFRGPSPRRVRCPISVMSVGDHADFFGLQELARWVFENDGDLETRHALAAAEIGRTAAGSDDPAELVRMSARGALDGARMAHQMGLHRLSLDALKALADLRKAVSDEAAKLAEATRQLATAVAGALFTGIGVVAARMTLAANSEVFRILTILFGVVLVSYILSVVVSGMHYLRIQRSMRNAWRNRLYRYLSQDDYELLVLAPARAAESAFKISAIGSFIIALLLAAGMILFSLDGGYDFFIGVLSGNWFESAPVTAPEPNEIAPVP